MAVINGGTVQDLCLRLCVDVQTQIDSRADSPINNENNNNAVFDFIASDANNSNNMVAEALGSMASKAKPIAGVEEDLPLTRLNVIWTDPECGESDGCDTDGTSICAVEGSYTSKRSYAEVILDSALCETGAFNLADFRGICETSQFAMTDELQRAARRLKRALNTLAIENVAASLSDYANGVNSGTNPIIFPVVTIGQDGLALPNNQGIVTMRSQYRKKYWEGGFNIFGGDAIAEHNDLLIGQGRTATPFTYDPKIDSIFETLFAYGISNVFTLPTGVINFLQWNRNAMYMDNPQLQAMSPSYTRTMMVIDGVTYDLDLYYDECNAAVKWRLAIDPGFFKIPDSEYCAGTGGLVLRYGATCGASTCNDFSINTPAEGEGEGEA
jgi:hypothetical protein